MSWGFSAINNVNGVKVIDQNFRAYRVTSKGSFTLTTNGQVGSVSLSGDNPIVFWRWTAGRALYIGRPVGGVLRVANRGAGTTVVDWMMCSLDTSGATGGGYGLAVFDGSGRTVFSTTREYVRFRDSVRRATWVGSGDLSFSEWAWSASPGLDFPSDAYVMALHSSSAPKNASEYNATAHGRIGNNPQNIFSLLDTIPNSLAADLGIGFSMNLLPGTSSGVFPPFSLIASPPA